MKIAIVIALNILKIIYIYVLIFILYIITKQIYGFFNS